MRALLKRGPHFLIFLFSPSYILFLAFFKTKLESTTLIYPRGPYSGHSLNGKGGFDFRRGPYQYKKIGAIFFYYGLSHIQDSRDS
jgi:hypothetical protein